MKILIAALALQLATLLPTHAAETQTLKLYNGVTKKYDEKKFVKIKNSWVSDSCAKNANCAALKALDKKITLPPAKNGLAGNPGSSYCLEKGGVARILKDQGNSEYDYCLFKDGSMIDSWNMYMAHYPPNVIK